MKVLNFLFQLLFGGCSFYWLVPSSWSLPPLWLMLQQQWQTVFHSTSMWAVGWFIVKKETSRILLEHTQHVK